MLATNKVRTGGTVRSISHGLSAQVIRLAIAFALCFVVSGTGMPQFARAQVAAIASAQTFVAYDSNHVPDAAGSLLNMTGLTHNDPDGHMWDIYNNELQLNTDSTITDVNNVVVGYVSDGGPVETIP